MSKQKNICIFSVVYILCLYHCFYYNPINNRYSPVMTGLTCIFNVGMYVLYLKNFFASKGVEKIIALQLCSVLITVLVSVYRWNTPVINEFAQLGNYFSPLLFLLFSQKNISTYRVEKILFWFAIAYLCCWLLQIYSLPNIIFGNREIETENLTRGFYRFYIATKEHLPFLVFFFIGLFFQKRKTYLLVFSVLVYMAVVFHVARQMIFWAGFFALLLALRLYAKRLRTVVTSLVVFGIAFFYIQKLEVVSSLFQMTEDTLGTYNELGTGNIRFEAMAKFIQQYSDNFLSVIFGNGVPVLNTALYSHEMQFVYRGYYRSDVGFVGMFCDIGLMSVVLYIILLYVILFKTKVQRKHLYLKYYLLYMIFSYLGAHSLTSNLVFVIMAIYILIVSSKESFSIDNKDPKLFYI